MSALARCSFFKCLNRKLLPTPNRCVWRDLHTSKKNRETTTAISQSQEEVRSENVCKTEPKNWMSYGFSVHDKEEDRHFMHSTMFMFVTVTFVFGGFILAYRPDDLDRDWAQREGYLELRRREQSGLPLVDPNYLPLDVICIPSDEELGDAEIII